MVELGRIPVPIADVAAHQMDDDELAAVIRVDLLQVRDKHCIVVLGDDISADILVDPVLVVAGRSIKEVRRRISELMEEERPYHGKEPEDVRNAAFTGSIPVARLQAAFFALYDAIHEEEERWVPPEEVSLEAEIETLGSTLKRQGKVEFRSYFAKQKTRLRLAVTLMALLELMRLGKARLRDTAKGLVIEGGIQ